MLKHVALVSESSEIDAAQVGRVAAALQKQVARDFGPIWQVQATVAAFPALHQVPRTHWPIVVRDTIDDPSAAGYHDTEDGRPASLVRYSPDWALTCSHECLEMLADPEGNRLIDGPSPVPDQGGVRFLVEVCDPSEDIRFGYTVDGVAVSDFYTPRFFDPITRTGERYSFTGAIESPRTVLPGGYLSWVDPGSGRLWQETWFEGTDPVFVDRGLPDGRSLREFADSELPGARLSAV